MIEIKSVTKGYEKNKEVLKGVSVTVEDGSVFGLVGINGAGKSTLLRLISGVMKADEGEVCIDGENVYEQSEGTLRNGCCSLPHEEVRIQVRNASTETR